MFTLPLPLPSREGRLTFSYSDFQLNQNAKLNVIPP